MLQSWQALSKGFDSAILIAIATGIWYLSAALTKLYAGQEAEKKSREDANKSLEDKLMAEFKSLKAEIHAYTAGVSRAFRSVGVGLRQLGDSRELTAFAAATPAQVAALVQAHGFGQYATVLCHLTGTDALIQSGEELHKLGVAEGHVKPLLELFARQP